ncbi:MAG: GH92 family glycosyl hydrolase [Candidatus Pseudobacter hemicellulosilyticus]|uniref:GH92 family glycosyl hydrolase n=1 Tax=Candidatus Pseudobacter hemicellulosilyticus TaxID=3121375 RepID=A0AAJ5WRM9_9BACT|nr:MAG: GH92 family glycosyl hydrolase [Pseudobacter sp.]
MNKGSVGAIMACLLTAFSVSAQTSRSFLSDHVNPFIGTGANGGSLSGNNYPGATVPFGMVQLSPDTRDVPDWGTASGYDYNDSTIAGFSHTHLSGTGVAELFDVLMMPFTGEPMFAAGAPDKPGSGYRSRFSHKQEKASPGYYQVQLLDHDVNVELTATTHAGFHKYTYPADKPARLAIDLDHSLNKSSWNTRIIGAHIRIVDAYTVEGYRLITGWARLRKVYFRAVFSKPIKSQILADGGTRRVNEKLINGANVKAVLEFDPADGKPLLVKVGISPVSPENAKLNLQTEIPGWDFAGIKAAARNAWEKELSKIRIDATPVQQEIFYTALYHSFLQPNTLSDVNGEYSGADLATRKLAKGTSFYSTFSLWDTYRAIHPLYTLLQPQRTTDFVNSLLAHYDAYGYLPVWQLWGQENYCMIGNHAIPVVVDAILKGIPGIDVARAYEAVKQSSLVAHPNAPFDVWERYGYMPENIQSQSVSITLEMAYDDWCVAQLAKKLGKTQDYQRFLKRAGYYKNLYHPDTKFFQPKNDKGEWILPFDPFKYGANGGNPFTEGNAWQYFWYVPHAMDSLIALTGGADLFAAKLDSFFTIEHVDDGHTNDNASGFIGQYAHGNEPSHHVAYLYNYAGKPEKTQFYVSKIMNELYNNTSSGYAGNEDCGEMSAWYVFSALGFYPVNPANGVYDIGSPLVKQAVLQLPGGKTFTVKVNRKNGQDLYIQSVRLNGKIYTLNTITHADLLKGGVLEFSMGAQPAAKR